MPNGPQKDGIEHPTQNCQGRRQSKSQRQSKSGQNKRGCSVVLGRSFIFKDPLVPFADIGFSMLDVTDEKHIGSPHTERKKEFDSKLG